MSKLVKVNTKRTSPYAKITELEELFKPKRRLLEPTTVDFFPISIWTNIASNLNQVHDLVNLAKTCKSTYKATKPILIQKSCYDFKVTQDQAEHLTVQIHAVIPGDENRRRGMVKVTVAGENVHPKAAHTLESIRLSEMKVREVLVTSSSWGESEKCSICYFDRQGRASKIHLKSGTELGKDFDLEPAELLTSSNQPSEMVEKTIDFATVYYSLYNPYKACFNVIDVTGTDSTTYRHEESYILNMSPEVTVQGPLGGGFVGTKELVATRQWLAEKYLIPTIEDLVSYLTSYAISMTNITEILNYIRA